LAGPPVRYAASTLLFLDVLPKQNCGT